MSVQLGDALVTLGINDKPLRAGLDSAESKVKGWGSRIADTLQMSLGFALGGAITAGVGAISKGLQGMASSAFNAVAANESLTLSLQSLAASQLRAGDSTLSMAQALEAAGPIAADLAKFVNELAIKSPFSQEGVSKAVQTAQAYGFNVQQAKRLTQATIDMAAATGRGGEAMDRVTLALGQMANKGRASAEELNQLREAGAPVSRALDALGVTLDDVAKGSVTATDFIEALLGVMEGDFAGAAERQATSWAGLASTFGDITKIGLRTFFEGVLTALQPLAVAVTDAFSDQSVLDGMKAMGSTIADLITPAVKNLVGWFEVLPQKISTAVQFFQQLKDEWAGLSSGDILAGLAPGLAKLESDLSTALAALDRAHVGMLKKLEEDIAAAGDSLAGEIAKIAEKYSQPLAELQQRISDATADFNERETGQAEQFAKRRAEIEKRLAKQIAGQEEKLTELKRDHQKRRQKLVHDLMFAETEEQYLQIQQQLAQEDEKFNEQKTKTEQAGKEQQQAITEQLAEIEAEERKANDRLAKDRQRAFRDLDQAMAEINAKKAEEETKLQESYNQQVEMLQSRIEAENSAYEQQRQDLQNSFAQEMTDLETMTQARAAAIGKGLPHQIIQWAGSIATGIKEAQQAVTDFINLAAIPLQQAFDYILAKGQETWNWLSANIPQIWQEVQDTVKPALELIREWWDEHNDTVVTLVKLNWDTLSTIFLNGLQALLAAFRAGLAILRGDWETAGEQLKLLVQINFDTLTTIIGNAFKGIETVAGDSLRTIIGLFTDQDWTAIGKSVLEGIGAGLTEGAAALLDKAEEAGGDLLEGFKKVFGIESPSKLFRDQVGAQLAAGIGEGFQAGMGDVAKKAQDALKGLTPGRLEGAMAAAGPKNYNLAPVFNLPEAPTGFDRKGFADEIYQGMLKLLVEIEGA